MSADELGIIQAARRQEENNKPKAKPKRKAPRQDLVVVSRGPAKHGHVQIGSVVNNSIVGKVDVEVVANSVVVTVHRLDPKVGPVSLVVV